MNLQAIDHVALSVTDVDASAKWYCEVLGFERQHDDVWGGYPVFVGKNDAAIALFPMGATEKSETSSSSSTSSNSRSPIRVLHFAFRASRAEFLNAQKELKARKIEFEFQNHEVSHSIYFYDPDRHELEITTYEL